jgi:hypothetical protein
MSLGDTTQSSNTWTCSTFVDSVRRDTGSDAEVQPRASVINVTFETMQTSEVYSSRSTSSRETDLGSRACGGMAAWTQSCEEQDRSKKIKEHNR